MIGRDEELDRGASLLLGEYMLKGEYDDGPYGGVADASAPAVRLPPTPAARAECAAKGLCRAAIGLLLLWFPFIVPIAAPGEAKELSWSIHPFMYMGAPPRVAV